MPKPNKSQNPKWTKIQSNTLKIITNIKQHVEINVAQNHWKFHKTPKPSKNLRISYLRSKRISPPQDLSKELRGAWNSVLWRTNGFRFFFPKQRWFSNFMSFWKSCCLFRFVCSIGFPVLNFKTFLIFFLTFGWSLKFCVGEFDWSLVLWRCWLVHAGWEVLLLHHVILSVEWMIRANAGKAAFWNCCKVTTPSPFCTAFQRHCAGGLGISFGGGWAIGFVAESRLRFDGGCCRCCLGSDVPNNIWGFRKRFPFGDLDVFAFGWFHSLKGF